MSPRAASFEVADLVKPKPTVIVRMKEDGIYFNGFLFPQEWPFCPVVFLLKHKGAAFMFTGIVEAVGFIQQKKIQSGTIDFVISVPAFFYPLHIGESVSVNGVCLTITNQDPDAHTIHVTAVPETLQLTNLGLLNEQSLVNLERSLTLQSRLGGHILQGHIDEVGQIVKLEADGPRALSMSVQIPATLSRYIIKKGYIAVDGMSLTITDVADNYFSVTLIPHTREVTVVHHYGLGSKVNIEVDMVGKYIEKLVGVK